jgi:hypothetical protein
MEPISLNQIADHLVKPALPRHNPDFIAAFMDYASHGEAPRHMYFWAAVSAVAGALQRKVWIDQAYFKWTPNFFIILVAPPGVVSKSTTAGLAMDLLREVPDVHFGPDVITWPALVTAMAEATNAFEYRGDHHIQSALTLESSELGNLIKPQDVEMIDLFVSLWDGKTGSFEKRTKGCGSDSIQNPWINMIACTTPAWIAGNFPEYMIGGGFTSRAIFVYADAKAQFVAYPGLRVPPDLKEKRQRLVDDLIAISNLTGEYRLTAEAIEYGEAWYSRHYASRPINLDSDRFGGYIARKQTHLHKLAMVLAASSSSDLVIHKVHLETADIMLTDLEPDMQFVFSKIGRSDSSLHTERLVEFVHTHGKVKYGDAYRYVHSHFPSMRDYDDILAGCIKAGYIKLEMNSGENLLIAGLPLPAAQNAAR